MTQDALWFTKTSSSRPTIILCSSVNCSVLFFSAPGRMRETVLALAYILLSLLVSRAFNHWWCGPRCLSMTPHFSWSIVSKNTFWEINTGGGEFYQQIRIVSVGFAETSISFHSTLVKWKNFGKNRIKHFSPVMLSHRTCCSQRFE